MAEVTGAAGIDIPGTITKVTDFLASGTTGVVLKIVLVVVAVAAAVGWALWSRSAKIKKARETENKNEIRDRQDLAKQNETENRRAGDDSKAVDDFLKGE